jgi:diguanylate cyclase (GGDEF)-like protein
MQVPAEQIPLLVLSVVIASVGLMTLVEAALYREQKPGLAFFALLALGVGWEVALPLWDAAPGVARVVVLHRTSAANAFLLPALGNLFFARLLGAPPTAVRRVLIASASALALAAFSWPGVPAFRVLAPVSFLLLLANFLSSLLRLERRSRRHMVGLFLAVSLLVLGVLVDLASRREVLLARPLPVPALAPAFLLFTVLILAVTAEEERRLVARATTDPLTALPNRAAFLDRARAEIRRADRGGRSLAVAMLDIDHFKSFNDRFGHATGDRVLVAAAHAIAKTIRGIDLVGRWGGEEFVVLLVEADEASAPPAVERIREAVSALSPPRVPERLTLSAGIAMHRGNFERATIESLIKRADGALYSAKRSGRDRVSSERPAARPDTPAEIFYR